MEKKLQLQFIDSVRVMTSSLSNYVNNLFEGIHKIWCKSDIIGELNTKYCNFLLEYINWMI